MLKRLVLIMSFAASLAIPAQAMPVSNLDGVSSAPVEKTYGGCGPWGHRGPFGGCRWGGQWGGYWMGRPCPPGFHLGPWGRRCWPN